MSDPHTLEGQVQRARRLRETIENLKSQKQPERPVPAKSLREQVAERARQAGKQQARREP